MKLHLNVNVTQKHIRRGRARSSMECPLALALLDMGFEDAAVAGSYIMLRGYNQYWNGSHSCDTTGFLARVDSGLKVLPETFRVTLEYMQ